MRRPLRRRARFTWASAQAYGTCRQPARRPGGALTGVGVVHPDEGRGVGGARARGLGHLPGVGVGGARRHAVVSRVLACERQGGAGPAEGGSGSRVIGARQALQGRARGPAALPPAAAAAKQARGQTLRGEGHQRERTHGPIVVRAALAALQVGHAVRVHGGCAAAGRAGGGRAGLVEIRPAAGADGAAACGRTRCRPLARLSCGSFLRTTRPRRRLSSHPQPAKPAHEGGSAHLTSPTREAQLVFEDHLDGVAHLGADDGPQVSQVRVPGAAGGR